jgi:hypothetical protein
MKTITIGYDEYHADLEEYYQIGLQRGRELNRRELGPILDELMNLTRLEQGTVDGTPYKKFSIPMSATTDAYRRRLRELMIQSGLITASKPQDTNQEETRQK